MAFVIDTPTERYINPFSCFWCINSSSCSQSASRILNLHYKYSQGIVETAWKRRGNTTDFRRYATIVLMWRDGLHIWAKIFFGFSYTVEIPMGKQTVERVEHNAWWNHARGSKQLTGQQTIDWQTGTILYNQSLLSACVHPLTPLQCGGREQTTQ